MAPIRSTKTIKSPKVGMNSKADSKPSSKPSTSSKKAGSRPPPKEVKKRPGVHAAGIEKKKRKKERVYTDKELGLPALNMITPAGVQKPRGKKKGKIFVDDQESMMTILAMVNAEKEGQIESKVMKARQLEEIREAKRKEAEARHEHKKSKFEATKESLKRKKKSKGSASVDPEESKPSTKPKSGKKRVSFA
ncbi:putative 66s preribosome component loc1 [Phaeomoniella chlamydospora]|uniref:Putative 66s preribosome component loc1 n=1 Tax=Phaeomoniella chlamydospora TaxID=158046 RepID=A0A0G2GZF1_PHACM|nr:putative 66s preribosome component loc1 [Phaeomoniella chlamydospora]